MHNAHIKIILFTLRNKSHLSSYAFFNYPLTSATGKALICYLNDEISPTTEMDGQFIMTGDNNAFNSTLRSMTSWGGGNKHKLYLTLLFSDDHYIPKFESLLWLFCLAKQQSLPSNTRLEKFSYPDASH